MKQHTSFKMDGGYLQFSQMDEGSELQATGILALQLILQIIIYGYTSSEERQQRYF